MENVRDYAIDYLGFHRDVDIKMVTKDVQYVIFSSIGKDYGVHAVIIGLELREGIEITQ